MTHLSQITSTIAFLASVFSSLLAGHLSIANACNTHDDATMSTQLFASNLIPLKAYYLNEPRCELKEMYVLYPEGKLEIFQWGKLNGQWFGLVTTCQPDVKSRSIVQKFTIIPTINANQSMECDKLWAQLIAKSKKEDLSRDTGVTTRLYTRSAGGHLSHVASLKTQDLKQKPHLQAPYEKLRKILAPPMKTDKTKLTNP